MEKFLKRNESFIQNLRMQLTVYGILFFLSGFYNLLYLVKLREISLLTFRLTYILPYIYLSRPLFLFSVTALLGLFILLWSKKTVSSKVQIFCKIASFLLLVLYLLFLTYLFLFQVEIPFSLIIAFNYPFFYILLGVLTVLGFSKS